MIKLSVVIVNWNVRELLKDCLESIFKTSLDLELEVIVVDNNSSDGSVEMVKKKFPSVVLIENNKNVGFGTANNQGIGISKGEYILILNPDTIVFPNSLQKMAAFLDQNSDTGAVGPKILNPDGSIQFECARNFPTPLTEFFVLSTLYRRFPKSRIFGRYLMSYWDHNDQRQVDLLSGAGMMIRKKVFDEIGLFDEKFFMYAEEPDLFYRIKKQGWIVYFLPSAQIVHFWGKSTEQLPYDMVVEARRSMELFFKEYYGTKAVISHRLTVFFTAFFFQVYGFVMYLLSREEKRLKAKRIFLTNNYMFRWTMGLK